MILRRRAAWAAGSTGMLVALMGCNLIVGAGDYGTATADGDAETFDAMGSADVGHVDTGRADAPNVSDATPADGRPIDANSLDSIALDGLAFVESGAPDGPSAGDSSAHDASSADGSPPDAGAGDASHLDASGADTSFPDEGAVDASHPEAGYVDAPALIDVRADQVSPDTGGGADASVDAQTSDSAVGPSPDAGVKCGTTLPGATATAFQQLVRVCTLAASCDPEYFDVNTSQCITNHLFASSTAYTCLNSIASCADFSKCWGIGYAGGADRSTANNLGGGACVNNKAVDGDSAYVATNIAVDTYYDCDTLGGACAANTLSSGGMAECMVPPSLCSNADSDVHCSGTYAYRCIGGVAYGRDCSLFGSSCLPNGVGSGCLPTGPTCTTPGSATCNGSTLTVCQATGEAVSYDCSAAGEVCSPTAGACVSPGCTAPCEESCDDSTNKITVCVGGAPLVIDCAALDPTDFYGYCASAALTTRGGLMYAWCY